MALAARAGRPQKGPAMSSPRFPEPPAAVAPTPLDKVDAAVARVAARKNAWLDVSISRRIQYLKDCAQGVADVADAWVRDGSLRKGIAPGDVLEGEEWLAGPMTTVRNVRLLIVALEQGGRPAFPGSTTRPGGQVVAQVFPTNLQDKLMFSGVTAEVWMQPGKPASQGAIYRNKPEKGKVSLILGAGNVSSIPPMDALYKLFVEDEVVVLKMNPVNADAGPHLERAFKSLIDDGFMAVVYGGAEVGAHLAEHAQIDTLHVTGSDRTYDAIVWGSDPAEQARRKAEKAPKNTRPFTAELGCVTPVMVVPGAWSESELDYQARHVAGMVAQNASFNCNAAKVLVTAKGWPQREAFLRKVEAALAATPARKAYYPGAQQRYQAFVEQYPKAKPVGPKGDQVVPWTVIPDVSADKGEYALRNEAFCGVLAEVALDATDAEDFLKQMVPFANDVCWGTLSCCVLVHPKTTRDLGAVFEGAIADLRFGGIGINAWPGLIYGLVVTTWGAFPGHPPEDIQSGAGVVHNAFLFDHPERSVVRAPFVMWPTPAWFADHRNLHRLGRNLTQFETETSWGGLVKVALSAFKG
jgi:acyl-CoA reductase-like NAD-dependent aldehyde dehydrogenase